jgi:hypothetical protein
VSELYQNAGSRACAQNLPYCSKLCQLLPHISRARGMCKQGVCANGVVPGEDETNAVSVNYTKTPDHVCAEPHILLRAASCHHVSVRGVCANKGVCANECCPRKKMKQMRSELYQNAGSRVRRRTPYCSELCQFFTAHKPMQGRVCAKKQGSMRTRVSLGRR